MRDRRDCILCGAWWYRGDSPQCSHSEAEWETYRRRAAEPEGSNRHERRKLLKAGRARL